MRPGRWLAAVGAAVYLWIPFAMGQSWQVGGVQLGMPYDAAMKALAIREDPGLKTKARAHLSGVLREVQSSEETEGTHWRVLVATSESPVKTRTAYFLPPEFGPHSGRVVHFASKEVWGPEMSPEAVLAAVRSMFGKEDGLLAVRTFNDLDRRHLSSGVSSVDCLIWGGRFATDTLGYVVNLRPDAIWNKDGKPIASATIVTWTVDGARRVTLLIDMTDPALWQQALDHYRTHKPRSK